MTAKKKQRRRKTARKKDPAAGQQKGLPGADLTGAELQAQGEGGGIMGAPDPRVEQLLDQMLAGATDAELYVYAEREYGEDAPAAVAMLVSHLQEAGKVDRDLLRGFCLEAYQRLYRECLKAVDRETAIKALGKIEQMSR